MKRTQRYTYEEVKQCFEARNYKLLSPTYDNNNTKLLSQCPNGHFYETTLRNFNSGKGCKICGISKMIDTVKSQNNGLHLFQTGKFLKDREQKFVEHYGVTSPLKNSEIIQKRKETNKQRYGVEEVSQNPEIAARQRKGLKDKYGYEYTMQIPLVKEKFSKTLMANHGVPNLAYLSRCSSKESQNLFWQLHHTLEAKISEKDHFAELNGEFVIGPMPEYFKYDYVNSMLKKCIEYNGTNFHPRPEQNEDEINWKAFHPQTTVKEAREYESKKYAIIAARGYSILTVWDYEYHKDFKQLVNKCLSFLTQGNP